MSDKPILRISEEKCALLVIDLQEKLKPVIHDWSFLVERCCRLIRFFDLIKAPIKVTEQYPNGLGKSVVEICSTLKSHYDDVLTKTAFSCCGAAELKQQLESVGRRQWLLCGIESHVCVQQTAFDLLDLGFEVFVALDAVSSRHTVDHEISLNRMRDAGAILSTSESLMFEMIRDSKHPHFKEASALVKES